MFKPQHFLRKFGHSRLRHRAGYMCSMNRNAEASISFDQTVGGYYGQEKNLSVVLSSWALILYQQVIIANSAHL